MKNIRRNEGITLIALMVTVIVLMILAGVTLTQGTILIRKAQAENTLTNMITVRASSKVFAEEINGKTWALNDDDEEHTKTTTRRRLFEETYHMTIDESLNSSQLGDLPDEVVRNDNYEVYKITEATFEEMGLDKIKEDDNYAVAYSTTDYTMLDVIYKQGVEYNGKVYYSLSSLQDAMEDDA